MITTHLKDAAYLNTFDADPEKAILIACGDDSSVVDVINSILDEGASLDELDSIISGGFSIAPKVLGVMRKSLLPLVKTAVTAAAARVGSLAAEDAYPVVRDKLLEVFQSSSQQSGLSGEHSNSRLHDPMFSSFE